MGFISDIALKQALQKADKELRKLVDDQHEQDKLINQQSVYCNGLNKEFETFKTETEQRLKTMEVIFEQIKDDIDIIKQHINNIDAHKI